MNCGSEPSNPINDTILWKSVLNGFSIRKMAAFKNFAIRKVAIKKVLVNESEILLTPVQNCKKYITFGNLRSYLRKET